MPDEAMTWYQIVLDLFRHFDKQHFAAMVEMLGIWTYLVLFLIIFCETGLVVTPFLPGDSLLFIAGAVAALGSLDVTTMALVLTAAAILGDTVNYWVGHLLGPRLARGQRIRFIRQEHLDKTHAFFEKYGGKTIILARFVPIIRTFAPFVAGAGSMTYSRFISYNVIGGVVWVTSLVSLGFFLGSLKFVEDHFEAVIYAIVVISVLPMVIEFLRARAKAKREAVAARTAAAKAIAPAASDSEKA